ncbi:MAG: ABC transporter permease [Clostridiales bacterium]|nr:ABC transporter permease [Clostridiales bacterium]
MFWHNYKYRLKCFIRDKENMFWTLLFPLILATLFNMALSNISSAESFTEIKVAIVENKQYKDYLNFINDIEAVSEEKETSNGKSLFKISYVSKEEGERLLADNKIEGYIYFDDEINLVVKESGINESIIKSFLDDFQQSRSTMVNIINMKQGSVDNKLIEDLSTRQDYTKKFSLGKEEPDVVVQFFYALIAMTCLYGGLWGIKEVEVLQANQSPQGARLNITPTNKLKMFLASILAATTVQIIGLFLLLTYLNLVLKISFGNQFAYVLLTCMISIITGITYGTFIGALINKGVGLKIGIFIGATMIMSFMSGMMNFKVKYTIYNKMSILSYVNPANLITDSFYSLFYYDTYSKFYLNIGLLCIFVLVFSSVTYFILRRHKYASL